MTSTEPIDPERALFEEAMRGAGWTFNSSCTQWSEERQCYDWPPFNNYWLGWQLGRVYMRDQVLHRDGLDIP